MTTVIDETSTDLSAEATERLRTTTAAVRLSVSWLGVRKTLTPGQKAEAAESFGAEGQFLSENGDGLLELGSVASSKKIIHVHTHDAKKWQMFVVSGVV